MMHPFCKLAHPDNYVGCPWDLWGDGAGRTHWVEFFKRHLDTILALAVAAATDRGEPPESAERRAGECREEFDRQFDSFAAAPGEFDRVTIVTLDHWRDRALRRHGFVDAFIDLKRRENEKMLPFLPALCREIDSLAGREQIRAMIEGVFAGNIF